MTVTVGKPPLPPLTQEHAAHLPPTATVTMPCVTPVYPNVTPISVSHTKVSQAYTLMTLRLENGAC